MSFMLKINENNLPLFKTIIDTLSSLLDTANFTIDKENGMSLRSYDQTQTAMIELMIKKNFFAEFVCGDEITVYLGLEDLKAILGRTPKNSKLIFEYKGDQKVKITLEGKSLATFTLPLLEEVPSPTSSAKSLPLELSGQFKTGTLKDILSQISIIGDSVTIIGNDQEITFMAEEENRKVEIPKKMGESDELIALKTENEVTSTYPVENLNIIAKLESYSKGFNLEFSSGKPIRVTLHFGDEDDVEFIFLNAPFSADYDDDDYDDDDDDLNNDNEDKEPQDD